LQAPEFSNDLHSMLSYVLTFIGLLLTHSYKRSNIVVQGITILAPTNSPNTDGINPGMVYAPSFEGCRSC